MLLVAYAYAYAPGPVSTNTDLSKNNNFGLLTIIGHVHVQNGHDWSIAIRCLSNYHFE